MKEERYWLDIESGIIFDTENEKDFDPVTKLNEQDQQIAELQENQNQKAIECLKEIRKKLFGTEELDIVVYIASIQDAMILIHSKIKELEGEKE